MTDHEEPLGAAATVWEEAQRRAATLPVDAAGATQLTGLIVGLTARTAVAVPSPLEALRAAAMTVRRPPQAAPASGAVDPVTSSVVNAAQAGFDAVDAMHTHGLDQSAGLASAARAIFGLILGLREQRVTDPAELADLKKVCLTLDIAKLTAHGAQLLTGLTTQRFDTTVSALLGALDALGALASDTSSQSLPVDALSGPRPTPGPPPSTRPGPRDLIGRHAEALTWLHAATTGWAGQDTTTSNWSDLLQRRQDQGRPMIDYLGDVATAPPVR